MKVICMKKSIVIGASSKIQTEIEEWVRYFESNDYNVLNYPKNIENSVFMDVYPGVHKRFFETIMETDVFFLLNEDQNGIEGYIGAEAFAELCFAVSQNILYNSNKKVYIMKMPGKEVQCYDEIKLWLNLKWIEIFEK